MRYLPLPCGHTEHARRFSGLYGRYWSQTDLRDYWVPCDSHMGDLVYCGQHLRVHSTGWCTVSEQQKVAMKSTTLEAAYKEARKLGLELLGD